MNSKVVYTALFGKEHVLHDPSPDANVDGFDFVCFTDNPDLKSYVWEIILVPATYADATRNSKKPKLLPHRYLPQYEISIWIDADVQVTGDLNQLVDDHLGDDNYAVFDHTYCSGINSRNCIYKEAEFIHHLANTKQVYKDDLHVIDRQMGRYKQEGYPAENGQARNTVIVRRHNQLPVIDAMELWWTELKHGSKRDQLSFNYAAWKTGLRFHYIPENIDDNPWVELKKRWRQLKRREQRKANEATYDPISLDYFLQMELAHGGGGKEVITDNGRLKTVADVVEYFTGNADYTPERAASQYFNCMKGGFRHNVGDHHVEGWNAMTPEYYNQRYSMTDEEIAKFLRENPVEFDNGYIRHSYHRAVAMIGRLIDGNPYIPFYMRTEQIYDQPRAKDGQHRIKPLTTNVRWLAETGILSAEFTVCQSGILALMGIRQNDDLDIVITKKARYAVLNGNPEFARQGNVEIFAENRGKFQIFDAQGDTDLVENYSFQLNGFNFLEPRFYFSRKNRKTERDLLDWAGIKRFFDRGNHRAYPFNRLGLTNEQWGIYYI